MNNLDTTENRKKPQFGTRYLNDPDQVFKHNAWDDVEWDEDLKRDAEEKIKLNSQTLVSPEDQEKYEADANQFWDKFYNIHTNRFFKDRHWLFTEFPELCSDSQLEISTNKEGENFTATSEDRINILEVGCGVGNTVFPILEANANSNVFVYCCDFSEVAVSLVKSHPQFSPDRCCPFVCDVSADDLGEVPCPEGSLDFILMVFVLSAVHPDKFFHCPGRNPTLVLFFSRMQSSVARLSRFLKPGGRFLFRDYGRFDLVQLRFRDGRCLSQHFYVRGDGTRVYFFEEDEVDRLFTSAGLVKTQLYSSKRLQVNRGKHLKMYRVWIQAQYTKPVVEEGT